MCWKSASQSGLGNGYDGAGDDRSALLRRGDLHLDGAAADAARIDAVAWTQSADGVPVFESAIALDAGVRTAAYSTGHNCEKVLAASSIAGCSVLVLEDVSLLEASLLLPPRPH